MDIFVLGFVAIVAVIVIVLLIRLNIVHRRDLDAMTPEERAADEKEWGRLPGDW